MNTPEPAREIDRLIERLVFLKEAQSVNEIELQRLFQEAKRLLPYDPGDAHMVLGMVAYLKGDDETARAEHQKSLNVKWTPLRAFNYAGTLGDQHYPQEALNQSMHIIEQGMNKHDPMVLRNAVIAAYSAGHLHQAATLLAQYNALGLAEEGKVANIAKQLPDILSVVDTLGLTDEVIASIQEPAWAAIRETESTKRKMIRVEDSVVSDERSSILRTYWVPVSEEEGHALNWRMIEIRSEQDEAASIEDFCPMIVGSGSP
jgi:hypothetical protein